MTTRPRVYLAGPDVFRPDAEQHFAMLAAVCEKHGLEALSPFCLSVDITSAQAIYEANMAKLKAADGVVANLAPFRGEEPDSGTVFEVGVAAARGVPVVGYGAQKLAPGLAGAVTLAGSAEGAIRVMAVRLTALRRQS